MFLDVKRNQKAKIRKVEFGKLCVGEIFSISNLDNASPAIKLPDGLYDDCGDVITAFDLIDNEPFFVGSETPVYPLAAGLQWDFERG